MKSVAQRALPELLEDLLSAPEERVRWSDVARAFSALRQQGKADVPPELLVRALELRRQTKDYSDELYALADRARVQRRLAPMVGAMGRRAAPVIAPLVETLREPLMGGCRPECCFASEARVEQIRARLAVLQTLRRIRVDVGTAIPPHVMSVLLAPSSRKIALGAMELVAQSPESVRHHRAAVVESLEHPYVLVVAAALRGLSKLSESDARAVLPTVIKALSHDDAGVRRWAIRAVVTLLPAAKEKDFEKATERLARLADRDSNRTVRAQARRARGKAERSSA